MASPRSLILVLFAALCACNQARPLTPATEASRAECGLCHGSADNAAPPRALSGSASTGDPAVGAHQAHVRGGPFRSPLGCSECHPPRPGLGTPGHADGTVDVSFGPLATSGGAAPRWDRARLGCAATYCHGATLAGGTLTAPQWTRVDGTQATCGSCHGLPPATLSAGGDHPAVSGGLTACATCHARTVRADGTIDVDGGAHVDGLVEVESVHPAGWSDPAQHGHAASRDLQSCTRCHGAALDGGSARVSCDACHTGGGAWRTNCTFCHGDASRATAVAVNRFAPPRGTQGETAATEPAVGAHQRHLTGSTSSAPVVCTECHAVGAIVDLAHLDRQVQLTWGPLATSGGAAPAFAGTSCSASYCHGTFPGGAGATPSWTGGPLSCSSCHGVPPATGQHGRSQHLSAGCTACHGTGYSSTTANPAAHPDGVKDVGGAGSRITTWTASTRTCAPACHGSERW